MSSGAVVIIVIAVIVVAAVTGWAMTAARRRRLQRQFGPEYDRVVLEQSSHRKAEHELAARERRVRGLNIQPLTPSARAAYAGRWSAAQERFVDEPAAAVAETQSLVVAVMRERGYPTEDHDQLADDLSVEHASTLLNYRQADEISQQSAAGGATTEDLRQAMIHYRLLFSELLGEPMETAAGNGAAGNGTAGNGTAGTRVDTGVSVGQEPARNAAVSGEPANGAVGPAASDRAYAEPAEPAGPAAASDQADAEPAGPAAASDLGYAEPAPSQRRSGPAIPS